MPAPRKDVPPGVLLVSAIVVLLVAGTATWFMIPEPQSQHVFASPTGASALSLGEYCTDQGCLRRIVAEYVLSDGNRVRRGCAADLPGSGSIFADPEVEWSADEKSVQVNYAPAGSLSLNLERDCTLTE